MFLSNCFKEFALNSGKLYAFDLLGAVIAVFAFIYFIDLGGIALLLISSLIASLVSTIFIIGRTRKRHQVFVLLMILASVSILFLNYSKGFPGEITLSSSYHKEMFHFINHPSLKSRILSTKWSSFGRTDLIQSDNNPNQMVFFIDGSAGSGMYKFNGDY